MITLVFLALQVRQRNYTMGESNRLERAAAIDRHADSISRWRGCLMENADLATIWLTAYNDGDLSEIEILRLNNLWVDFANTPRANYGRAKTVGDQGLVRQAVVRVVAEVTASVIFKTLWERTHFMVGLASPEFVKEVDRGISEGNLEEVVTFKEMIMKP
ncbi:MAG: hypothetical protein CMQ06_06540 [Gammaproteobacteria bacterium]|nr:hypothetical protein [Gammaproteobacteria bacterium]